MAEMNARFAATVKPKATRMDYPDHLVPGLSLRVTPAGVKTWALRYRNTAGARLRWTIGSFSSVSLAKAREKARHALRKIPTGSTRPLRSRRSGPPEPSGSSRICSSPNTPSRGNDRGRTTGGCSTTKSCPHGNPDRLVK